MKTLDEIGLTTGAGGDRASDRHDYMRIYDSLFSKWRDEPIRFLEIGVEFGITTKVWLEYFTKAHIFGVDIKRQHAIEHERFTFSEGDQRDPQFWKSFSDQHGGDWQIVIDDGCHHTSGIQTSLFCLWHRLNHGGIYVVEDLMCSYHESCREPDWPTQIEFLKTLIDETNAQTRYVNTTERRVFPKQVHGSLGIEWIRFSEELAIICKK